MTKVQNILVVDDDEVFRERLAQALVRRGFSVRCANGYDSALRELLSFTCEVALVDLKMAGKTGLELLQSLRSTYPTTQVIMLTGYGSIATAIDAMRLGAAHYLSKPVDADDVMTAIGRLDANPLQPDTNEFEAPSLARAEWEHINRVLSDTGGNISEAARRLGVHRRSLQRKLQKYPPSH